MRAGWGPFGHLPLEKHMATDKVCRGPTYGRSIQAAVAQRSASRRRLLGANHEGAGLHHRALVLLGGSRAGGSREPPPCRRVRAAQVPGHVEAFRKEGSEHQGSRPLATGRCWSSGTTHAYTRSPTRRQAALPCCSSRASSVAWRRSTSCTVTWTPSACCVPRAIRWWCAEGTVTPRGRTSRCWCRP